VARRLPVRPTLFDVVIDYAEQIESGDVVLAGRVTRTSPLVTFIQNFFAQFFDNEVKSPITSIGSEAKRTAVRARLRLRKEADHTSTVALITWFEAFCDTYPDILALGYMGRAVDFRQFLNGDLLDLLARCRTWADEKGYVTLNRKATTAHRGIRRALEASDGLER
jgi:hypothetical protein